MTDVIYTDKIPVLALRGLTVFPNAVTHFDVGREKSARALEKAMSRDQKIYLVTQREVGVDDPSFDDLYPVGTVAQVKQVLRMPGDSVRILVSGEYRARVTEVVKTAPYLCACVESIPDAEYAQNPIRAEALSRVTAQLVDEFAELSQRPVQEVMMKILSTDNPGYIADAVAQMATFGYEDKMQVLMQLHPMRRLELCNRLMVKELEVLRLENEIQDRTQQVMDKHQREYYLREQMKVIRTELGENDEEAELDEYRAKIRKLKVSEEVSSKLEKEVQRLSKQPFGSAEATVIRSYLDTALALPWNTSTESIRITAPSPMADSAL